MSEFEVHLHLHEQLEQLRKRVNQLEGEVGVLVKAMLDMRDVLLEQKAAIAGSLYPPQPPF